MFAGTRRSASCGGERQGLGLSPHFSPFSVKGSIVKIRITLALVAALSLALAAVAFGAQTEYKVTGGGQTFASSSVDDNGKPTVKGPGDTITFQAFIEQSSDADGPGSPATGQVNIIDRDAGATTAKGKGQHFRGTVTCAYVMPESDDGRGYAELHGTGTTKNGSVTPFVVRIQDNGQGNSAETDFVEFDYTDANANCEDGPSDEEFEFTLARGNAKIHKANPSQSGAKSAKSTSLLALR